MNLKIINLDRKKLFILMEKLRERFDEISHDIVLAVDEIGYNGIKHGKNVMVDIYLENNFLVMIFESEGIKIEDKYFRDSYYHSSNEMLTREGGMGLYITRKIVDEFNYSFSENKNIIQIKFDIKKRQESFK